MRRLVLAAAVAGSLVIAPAAQAATWTTLATRTATGESVKVINEALTQPLALRLKSRSESEGAVAWVVTCAVGEDVRAVSGSWFPDLGFDRKRLPLPLEAPETCQAIISINAADPGPLRVSLQQQQ